MKTYNKFFGFKSIFYFCSLPLRLDSYKGCTYGCLYCFSQNLNNRKAGFHKEVIPANYKKFKNFMESTLLHESGNGLLKSCIRRRIPIHFGCVSDPLQPYELKTKTSLHLLNILNEFKYPFIFCTKSGLIKNKEYLEILKNSDVSVQISFSTLDDNLGKSIEPKAPSPTERLNILKLLADNGIHTVARIQPFLYPKENIKLSIFKKFSEAGVKHIVLEHLRIPTNSRIKVRNKLWSALDMDIIKEYRKLGIKHSRVNYELCSEKKIVNLIDAQKIVHSLGMSFGSGDNDLHHFSDHLCCCGKIENNNGKNYYDGHLGYGAFQALHNGDVSYDYIEKHWQPVGSIKEYLNSDCRILGSNTVLDLLRKKIDNPNSSNSPSSFYGIEFEDDTYKINNDIREYFTQEEKKCLCLKK